MKKTKVPSLKGLIKGDLIVITGRKSPIEVVEKYDDTVLYMGPKSAQGMLVNDHHQNLNDFGSGLKESYVD